MSDKTLYLIQSSFSHTDQILTQLDQIYTITDHVILMGDAVLYVHDHRLQLKKNLYILENDIEILAEKCPEHFKLINYTQFADLILDFTRCVSLK
jgi:sulfur relay protein TusB/DsrH